MSAKIFHAHTSPDEKKNVHTIFSSQLRADQMPGPPWEGQLMCTLFLSEVVAHHAGGAS